jgi:thymidine kinase
MAREIHIITGPMFAGKTTELIRRAHRLARKRNILIVNSILDSRTDNSIANHDGMKIDAIKVALLDDLRSSELYQLADIVCIDEAQFFTDLIEFIRCEEKVFHVSGLMFDSDDKPFGQMLSLLPCESITQLTAICQYCNCDAPYTRFLGQKDQQIEVGGAGKYVAVCRNHKQN